LLYFGSWREHFDFGDDIMQFGPAPADAADWMAFMARLEAAEEEFARGCPDEFKALWSHANDVTICGAFGGEVELGWDKVAARLDWASSKYADGTRSRQEISGTVGTDFAYVVQTEIINYCIAGTSEKSKQELRVTMVFRRESDGWRIVHRHADSHMSAQPLR
jgi:ketosteroid isomerase-like protein